MGQDLYDVAGFRNDVEGVKRMVREPGRDLNWRHPHNVSVCGPTPLVELVRVPSWLVGQVGGVPLGVGVSPPSPPLTLPRHLGPLCGLQGWTALNVACLKWNPPRTEIVKLLVEANADVTIPDNVSLAVQLGGKGVVMGRGLQRPTDRTPLPPEWEHPPALVSIRWKSGTSPSAPRGWS